MRLFAISDLHLASVPNRRALEDLGRYPDDWLIVAGDVAERLESVEWALSLLAERFAKVLWVPGNHELWSIPNRDPPEPRGVARYHALVEIARTLGVVTPEDPYPVWLGALPNDRMAGIDRLRLVPLFLLYDYSFRPAEVPLADVISWAEETHNVCSDELLLTPEPHPDRISWCRERLAYSGARLAAELADGDGTVLINHWPFRRDLVRIPRVPRFTPWCGTVETVDWHKRYRAYASVSGHLHTRRTDIIEGTRFEEVSLGYPRQWDTDRTLDSYLRQII
jgi:hypothetical protein